MLEYAPKKRSSSWLSGFGKSFAQSLAQNVLRNQATTASGPVGRPIDEAFRRYAELMRKKSLGMGINAQEMAELEAIGNALGLGIQGYRI